MYIQHFNCGEAEAALRVASNHGMSGDAPGEIRPNAESYRTIYATFWLPRLRLAAKASVCCTSELMFRQKSATPERVRADGPQRLLPGRRWNGSFFRLYSNCRAPIDHVYTRNLAKTQKRNSAFRTANFLRVRSLGSPHLSGRYGSARKKLAKRSSDEPHYGRGKNEKLQCAPLQEKRRKYP